MHKIIKHIVLIPFLALTVLSGSTFSAHALGNQTVTSVRYGDKVIEVDIQGVSSKLDRRLKKRYLTVKPDETLPVLVYTTKRAKSKYFMRTLSGSSSKRNKREALVLYLKNEARNNQANIVSLLMDRKQSGEVTRLKAYWIADVLAVTATKDVIEALAAMDDVERIHAEQTIKKPILPKMIPLAEPSEGVVGDFAWGIDKVKASRLWAEGYDGTGVVIASIDTGVDMTHPDLAGKMAPIGNGALGWFDPYAGSAAPIDTIGHGTHTIATMVGGNANALNLHIGMAPGAMFYSVRAFGGDETEESVLLDAGQWILDPDGDPSTDDAPDIVNGSWGSEFPGSIDPWYRTMVQNWTAADIIPVWSSGNSGPGYRTASDPGNYPESFSVGATDINDNITDFSSKGSSYYDDIEIIKPDMSAPGINIISALAKDTDIYGDGQNFIGEDLYLCHGTSMAAPHVAGAAALLKQKHPYWSAEQIRLVLTETAVDIGESIYAQGTGRLEVITAAEAKAIITPPNKLYGANDGSTGTWQASSVFTLQNISDSSESYDIAVKDNNPPGITYDLSATSVELAPQEQIEVVLYLSVDNEQLPFSGEEPGIYQARVSACSGADACIDVPFGFNRATGIELLADNPIFIAVHNRLDRGYPAYGKIGPRIFFPVSTGVYDIWVVFRNPNMWNNFVIREGVPVGPEARTVLTVDPSEAVHLLKVIPTDKNGNAIPNGQSIQRNQDYSIRHKVFPTGLGFGYTGYQDQFNHYISDLSDNYEWDFNTILCYNDDVYTIGDYIDAGITSDRTFQYSPSDLEHVRLRFHFSPEELALTLSQYPSMIVPGGVNKPLGSDLTANLYMNPTINPGIIHGFFAYGADVARSGYEILRTLPVASKAAGAIGLYSSFTSLRESDPYYAVPSEGLFEFGLGPDHIHLSVATTPNSRDKIVLARPDNRFAGLHGIVYPQFGAYRYLPASGDIHTAARNFTHFELWCDDALISEGDYLDFFFVSETDEITADLPVAGAYTLNASFDKFFVHDVRGKSTAYFTFDTTIADDPNPPYMDYFRIHSDDDFTDTISSDSINNEIICKVGDAKGLGPVSLFYKLHTHEPWIPLRVETTIEGEVTALLAVADLMALSEGVSSYFDIKVEVADLYGNTLVHTFSPGFYFDKKPSVCGDGICQPDEDAISCPEDCLVEVELFTDSFEVAEWNGLWIEDRQNDWDRCDQRAVDGAFSAQVDGRAINAALTSVPIDLQGASSVNISFSWYIENSLDTGEYIAFDVSVNGGVTWNQMAILQADVDEEETWHDASIDLTHINTLQIRFRGKMSVYSEDANVDDVRVTTVVSSAFNQPPAADAGADLIAAVGERVNFDGSASNDPDGFISAYDWDFGDGETASGETALHVYTTANIYTVTLTVTDNEGATDTDTLTADIRAGAEPVVVFAQSFETGAWKGSWTQDNQNDWYRSDRRSADGSYSAEVNGRAANASLISAPIDLQGSRSATITFSWYIENSLDSGEYVAFDVSTSGGAVWHQKAILQGNVDTEGVWHDERIDLSDIDSLQIRFRAKTSLFNENANIDNVKITVQ